MKQILLVFILLSLFTGCTKDEEETTTSTETPTNPLPGMTSHTEPVSLNVTSPADSTFMNLSSGTFDLTLSGECDFTNEFVIKNNGVVLTNGLCTGFNFFMTLAADTFIDGENSLSFHYEEKALATYLVTVDSTPPEILITNFPSILTANYLNYTLSGTCSENNQAIEINIGSISSSTICQNGSWSLSSLDLSLLPDASDISITAAIEDIAGNSNSTSASTLKDTVSPEINITEASNITNANTSNYSVVGTCSENELTIELTIGSIVNSTNCSNGAWIIQNIDLTTLSDTSELLISASVNDTSGNNTVSTQTVSKDTLSDFVAITSAQDIDQSNHKAYEVSGTCSKNNTIVSLSIGGTLTYSPNCSSGVWSVGQLDVSSLLDSDTIAIVADHGVATQATLTVSKNTTLPTVTVNSAASINLSNQTSYQLSGNCSENNKLVAISFNDGEITFNPTCTNGSWSTGFQDVSTLAEGDLTLAINHANDSGDNATPISLTITKNTTGPSLVNLSVPTTYINSLELTWDTIIPGGMTITDYFINYRVKGSSTWLLFSDSESNTKAVTITGLMPSVSYEFRVMAKYNGTSETAWSAVSEGTTKPESPIFSSKYNAMNVGGATEASVVAFYDETNITLNGEALVTLNKGQVKTFTTTQFDMISADKAIYTAGRRGSGSDNKKGNIVFNPTSWAGKSFSFNATRNNPQNLYIYAVEKSHIEVIYKNGVIAQIDLEADSTGTLSWSEAGSYQITSTGHILTYHNSGASGLVIDSKALPPSHTEIIGIPSSSMRLTSILDGTNYNYWHSNSKTGSGSISKDAVISISPQGTSSLYKGDSLLIKSDKPISGASFADSNGYSSAPFLPTNLMKTKYTINVSADYVAFASKKEGIIEVYSPTQTIGVDTPIETLSLTRTGSESYAPYKARLGTTPEGYRFVSSVPTAAWYQANTDTAASKLDETVLYGSD